MPFPLRIMANFGLPVRFAARPLFACLLLHVVECRSCQQHVCSIFGIHQSRCSEFLPSISRGMLHSESKWINELGMQKAIDTPPMTNFNMTHLKVTHLGKSRVLHKMSPFSIVYPPRKFHRKNVEIRRWHLKQTFASPCKGTTFLILTFASWLLYLYITFTWISAGCLLHEFVPLHEFRPGCSLHKSCTFTWKNRGCLLHVSSWFLYLYMDFGRCSLQKSWFFTWMFASWLLYLYMDVCFKTFVPLHDQNVTPLLHHAKVCFRCHLLLSMVITVYVY